MQLNKKLILKELEILSFPREEYWVIMGAALVLHGIRITTNDIDIGCTFSLFNNLLEQGYSLKTSNSGKSKIAINDYINIYCEWNVEKIILIDLIPVADLQSIVNDKKRLGRVKDIEDIATIEKFMNKELKFDD